MGFGEEDVEFTILGCLNHRGEREDLERRDFGVLADEEEEEEEEWS